MQKFLGLNWKLNPLSFKEAKELAQFSDKKNVVIFSPFLFLTELKKLLKFAELGAQNVFWENKGDYTGEISPAMLKKIGVQYVLLGHFERRKYFNENTEIINKKVNCSLKNKLKIVLCIGENYLTKKRGINFTKSFILNELAKALRGVHNLNNLVVAYEPFWAIGKEKSDSPARSGKIIMHIKDFLKSKKIKNYKVIYGGALNSRSIDEFLKIKEIDGFLIGRASLKKSELNFIFSKINDSQS